MCASASSHGTPSSASSTATTSAWVSGGMSSCSRASSAMNSGGRRSGRVESTWPSFANVGPSSSSASRSRRARSAAGRSSRRPWRANTRPISAARPSSRSRGSSLARGAEPSATKTTLQRAACETRLATFASRNSVRSRMPASESTIRSLPRSAASRTIEAAGSLSAGSSASTASSASKRSAASRAQVTARPLGSGTARIFFTATRRFLPLGRGRASRSASPVPSSPGPGFASGARIPLLEEGARGTDPRPHRR